MSESDPGAALVFARSEPVVREIYGRLIEVLRPLGSFREDPKKTSSHLVRSTGFAGVHPRKPAGRR